ncbi:protein trichome birefringence-like 14 isoform X1 [Zingiber officinale]|uniref:protein trichome birefringence-like 14 isoform X1 n=2 Tax=Zingiber officinale TaxID=94328 RepID=UPI001C4ABCF7|nr:protein trichome birefringence-like 14 isoform X1 [Zingiber officinale]
MIIFFFLEHESHPTVSQRTCESAKLQYLGMKLGSLNGLKGKQLSLTLIIVFTTLLIWKWERIPHQDPFHQQQEQDFFPQVAKVKYVHEHPLAEEDFPDSDTSVHQTSETVVQALSDNPVGLTTSSKETEENKGFELQTVKIKTCNFAKGKWVADEGRPLYSGFECKQWLSESWSCRLTQREDFSYEKFRWKPEGCDMPGFEGSSFLRRMQDKTIALVGDSLGRQQFQSLMCMVTGGKERPDVEDVGLQYGFTMSPGDKRPNGWAYWFPSTNTTILYYWSATLCDIEPLNVSNPATSYAMHLDRPTLFLRQNLHKFDVLILNTGHHWNRGKLRANRWEMFVNGSPNTDRKLAAMGSAKDFAVHSVIKWLDSQLQHLPRLKAFYRSISPRHFFNGEWNSGGTCDNIRPLAGGSTVSQNAANNVAALSPVTGTRVVLLDITGLSQLRDESHISKYSSKGTPGIQDCLHWCLPGIPDTWNEVLAAQL